MKISPLLRLFIAILKKATYRKYEVDITSLGASGMEDPLPELVDPPVGVTDGGLESPTLNKYS